MLSLRVDIRGQLVQALCACFLCAETVKSYLQVGSTAVILSDAVFNKTALSQHDYARILQLSKIVAALLTSSD